MSLDPSDTGTRDGQGTGQVRAGPRVDRRLQGRALSKATRRAPVSGDMGAVRPSDKPGRCRLVDAIERREPADEGNAFDALERGVGLELEPSERAQERPAEGSREHRRPRNVVGLRRTRAADLRVGRRSREGTLLDVAWDRSALAGGRHGAQAEDGNTNSNSKSAEHGTPKPCRGKSWAGQQYTPTVLRRRVPVASGQWANGVRPWRWPACGRAASACDHAAVLSDAREIVESVAVARIARKDSHSPRLPMCFTFPQQVRSIHAGHSSRPCMAYRVFSVESWKQATDAAMKAAGIAARTARAAIVCIQGQPRRHPGHREGAWRDDGPRGQRSQGRQPHSR